MERCASGLSAASAAEPGWPVVTSGGSGEGASMWKVTPDRVPSSASLANRSACLFCSRGTQVYVVPNGASRLASSASGFMSGCLILQVPLICSTTSLESIRTSTSASGATVCAMVSPAIRPRYSATLLLAIPIVVPSSARTRPVWASLTSAPYAAGPGLPREPPSASTTTRRTASLIDPSQAALGGADQDPAALVAPDNLVVCRGPDGCELGVVQVEHATAAPPGAQQGDADPVLALTEAVVETHEVGGQLRGQRSASRLELAQRLLDLGLLGVADGGRLGDPSLCLGEPGSEGVEGALRLLETLHDLDLVVLQRGD